MAGPCLCGDPYCPSCGNPSAAAYADAIETLCERLLEMNYDEKELEFFELAGRHAVENMRKIYNPRLNVQPPKKRICPGCGVEVSGSCWSCVGDGGLRR